MPFPTAAQAIAEDRPHPASCPATWGHMHIPNPDSGRSLRVIEVRQLELHNARKQSMDARKAASLWQNFFSLGLHFIPLRRSINLNVGLKWRQKAGIPCVAAGG